MNDSPLKPASSRRKKMDKTMMAIYFLILFIVAGAALLAFLCLSKPSDKKNKAGSDPSIASSSTLKNSHQTGTDAKSTAKAKIKEADIIYMLDFCALDRLQNMQEAVAHSKCKRIMIDHHLNPDRKAASLVISHPQACSTCEIVFRLIWQMGGYEQMTRSGAACIYTGMMTDTGSFTYASKRPEIYYIIGQLLQKGIDKDKIYRNVNNNYSENRLRFVGYVLNSKLKFYEYQKASIFTNTREEMKEYHYIRGDAE